VTLAKDAAHPESVLGVDALVLDEAAGELEDEDAIPDHEHPGGARPRPWSKMKALRVQGGRK